MSGLATIAAVVGAGAAVGGLGYSVYSGQQQQSAQEAALKKQTTAQQTAQSQALSTERNNMIAEGDANKQTPDISAILKRAAATGTGLSSTLLTGPNGTGGVTSLGGTPTLLGS